MVFVYRPDIERDVKLLSHVSQFLVVAYYAWYVDIKLSSLVSCQKVVKAVAHLADENSHSWFYVVEVEVARHRIFLSVQSVEILFYFISWYEEFVEFPFHSHKEYSVLPVDILVKVYDVTLVVCYEPCHFRYYARLVWAVK